jgi:hypothetical protein
MPLLQQVMCQRFAQSLRVLFQVLRMAQEAAPSDCRSDLSTWLRPTDNVRSKRLTFHSTSNAMLGSLKNLKRTNSATSQSRYRD